MSTQSLTYEGILKMFEEVRATIQATTDQMKETADQMKETDRKFQETDRKMKETDRKMRETDKRIEKLTSNMGSVDARIGQLVEHMIGGKNVITQFQSLGYNVIDHSRNIVFGIPNTADSGQIDLLLDDGNVAILVEVKTTLRNDDVLDHIERLEKYRRWKDSKGESKKRYIGALACALVEENVLKFAQKNGMYVIRQLGNTIEIVPSPEGFKAKEW